ncbi:hypothetical protein LOTGIDRAFT_172674 [Lottia gigantea]|uniref:Uncharacterized protein n=1 Tax=Lottia gigantea TaxID=225164 RepID=V4B205_LOTGI|nr:hypothetical protein LOTGIDRAFT_172674 [Lottia gigantea]ESP01501.1 hypothetical protein LOTGIDRAFT_172674 [Lottia gigantea]
MNQLRRKSSFTVPIKDVSLSQMLERNEASQETGFTIPEAPSQPCKNLTNEGDVTLSQIIGKRPYPKFTAPVLNKEMNDKSDYSVFSQKDLSLSQMLASPPRRSQSLRVSQAIKTQQNKPYDSQYHGSGSTTQMTLFKSHEDRENKMNEGMNKTPACFKPRNNDHVYTPALLQLPGNVAKLRSVEEIRIL